MNGVSDKQIEYANTVKANILHAIDDAMQSHLASRPNTARTVERRRGPVGPVTLYERTDAELAAVLDLDARKLAEIERLREMRADVEACDEARDILDYWSVQTIHRPA